ncbi:PqqD family protein [bacterium]|nr:PqqD family protein [bacterium]
MTQLVISKDVLSKTVGDEEVLVDLSSGSYFGLNPVGTQIWSLIKSGLSQEQIIADLVEIYSANPQEISSDVVEFIHLLKEKKFVNEVSQSVATL